MSTGHSAMQTINCVRIRFTKLKEAAIVTVRQLWAWERAHTNSASAATVTIMIDSSGSRISKFHGSLRLLSWFAGQGGEAA